MKFTPHCSYNLKTRCQMWFGNVIWFRVIPMYLFTKEALKRSTCTIIVAFIPVESVIKCCFKLYADESSMADIFRYCMGWANETMKFNEVHSRKSTLLFWTLRTLEIEKRYGEKWNDVKLCASVVRMKSQMPTVPVVARYVYLTSGKALTWNQSHVLSMFQLSQCHFLYTSKN